MSKVVASEALGLRRGLVLLDLGERVPDHERGGQKAERWRVIDWEQPANNDFLLVSQFSVTGGGMSNVEFSVSNHAKFELRISTVELKELRNSHLALRTSPRWSSS